MGYEKITAEQAKLSGMFALPGAPRQQALDPSKLQAFMDQPVNAAAQTALNSSNSRQAKRLFAYNIPSNATGKSVAEFFNLHLNGLNVTQEQDPCSSAQISKDYQFALLEFKTSEDATVALILDGVSMEDEHVNGENGESNGQAQGLSIKRPKDYISPPATSDAESMSDGPSSVVLDSANKICVTRIPTFIDDTQVSELLSAFGELKSLVLVKDTGSDQSRGAAFCEYKDAEAVTTLALESLSGMEIGDSILKASRACVGITQVGGEMSVNAMSMLAGTESKDVEQGQVLCLLNMITADELMDDQDYAEILDDVKEECSKYGSVEDIKIPRPAYGSKEAAGVGKIYIKYDTPENATKALRALAGRKFSDRTVVVTYFGEDYFDVSAW